ncbi:MAG: hypothetical protein M3Z00_13075 [Actinomycetota bacterium]|nr:hypothetical protein [Actinomycetota bacterium]
MRGTASHARSSDGLRNEWRERSSAAGWAYQSDWRRESVDSLCEALTDGRDPWDAAERLGRDRAGAAVGLAETLADIDALATLVPIDRTEQLRRAVSLGWSEVATAPQVGIVDPMTGLASLGYLQVRLDEVYRGSESTGAPVLSTHALVVVRVRAGAPGIGRRLPMVIVANGMRTVFDAGETLSVLSDSVMTVLTEQEPKLPRKAALAQTIAQRLVDADEQAGQVAVRSWIEALPPTASMAAELLTDLSR